MDKVDKRKVLRAHWPPRRHGNIIQVDLPADLYEKIYQRAFDEEQSLADAVRDLIRNHA